MNKSQAEGCVVIKKKIMHYKKLCNQEQILIPLFLHSS